jgi:putative SOS response-associated peptidase YedK
MQVILPHALYDQWIDPSTMQADEVTGFLRPCDPSSMQAVPVSTIVNSPANDVPGCLEP